MAGVNVPPDSGGDRRVSQQQHGVQTVQRGGALSYAGRVAGKQSNGRKKLNYCYHISIFL